MWISWIGPCALFKINMEPFYLVIRRLEITIIVVFCFCFCFFFSLVVTYYILGDPGATSLFEGQKSPWELTLTEPVPEIVEFVPLIGQKKNDFSGQSARRSGRRTLSPSYTMWFSSSIGVCHRMILVESFRKRCNEAEEIANRNMGASKQYSSINFHGRLTEGISLILITNVHDFYAVVFGGAQT